MKRLKLIAIAALGLSAGACTVHKDYVKADKATFEAIAPEYKDYVMADPKLAADAKARRLRTVELWKVRIEEAAK